MTPGKIKDSYQVKSVYVWFVSLPEKINISFISVIFGFVRDQFLFICLSRKFFCSFGDRIRQDAKITVEWCLRITLIRIQN